VNSLNVDDDDGDGGGDDDNENDNSLRNMMSYEYSFIPVRSDADCVLEG
jgi:hypothetical protein